MWTCLLTRERPVCLHDLVHWIGQGAREDHRCRLTSVIMPNSPAKSVPTGWSTSPPDGQIPHRYHRLKQSGQIPHCLLVCRGGGGGATQGLILIGALSIGYRLRWRSDIWRTDRGVAEVRSPDIRPATEYDIRHNAPGLVERTHLKTLVFRFWLAQKIT